VCMQCHLEGDAAILQPGRHLSDFRPGDDLQEYVHYFLLNDPSRKTRAASHFEALAESQCKRKTGSSFSCITCHDPHYEPSAEEKNSYYDQKCVACHASGPEGAKKHFAVGRDCAIGMNLSKTLAAEGKVQDARGVVERVLEFNPDYPEGEQTLQKLGRAAH